MQTQQRTPKIYRIFDETSGFLLLAMAVFTPWALGTTETATIRVMNAGGCLLGLLLLGKWLVRLKVGFQPPRWDGGKEHRWPVGVAAVLTVVLLAYVLVSGLNYRGIIEILPTSPGAIGGGVEIEYRDAIPWLPHSYDGPRTIRAFWKYLGMALSFWAARDWLLTKSRHERKLENDDQMRFPTDRVQYLVWTLAISSAALSVVGILQRLDGTNKLLWIFDSPNRSEVNFGPYPYRANGAQYLNLIWPVVLGFWSALREKNIRKRGSAGRAGSDPHVLLLPLAGLIAAGPLLTVSRGGVLVLAGLLLPALLILFTAKRTTTLVRVLLAVILLAMVGGGWFLGGDKLLKRFEKLGDDKLGGREKLYESASAMEKDFRLWGSGAETFAPLFCLYRQEAVERWEAYVHDDYLETRITFGITGFMLILILLIMVPVMSYASSGIVAAREFILLLVTALAGMLLHARFDLPFQTFSLHFEFVLLCALLSTSAASENTPIPE